MSSCDERGRGVGGLMQGGREALPLAPSIPVGSGRGLRDWKGMQAAGRAGQAVARRRGHRRSDVMPPAGGRRQLAQAAAELAACGT